ncbi:MAG: hypothetical protein V3V34_11655 [Kiloniellales bacterium]
MSDEPRPHWWVCWEDAPGVKVSVESQSAWQAARSFAEARAQDLGSVGWREATDGSARRVTLVREQREDDKKTVSVRFAVDRRTTVVYHSRVLEET